MKSKIVNALAMALLLGFFGALFIYGLDLNRRVKYPEPSTYPAWKVQYFVRCHLLDVTVATPLYINLDTPTVIFEGKVRSSKGKAPIVSGSASLPETYSACFPDRSGEILTYKEGSREVWGFALASSKGEWLQTRERFRQQFDRLSKGP